MPRHPRGFAGGHLGESQPRQARAEEGRRDKEHRQGLMRDADGDLRPVVPDKAADRPDRLHRKAGRGGGGEDTRGHPGEFSRASLPGIGHVLGAQMFSERIGQIRRFHSAPAIVKYAGINPSVSQSGKFSSDDNHITKKFSPYLRRVFIWRRWGS